MKKVVLLAPVPPPYGGIATWMDRLVKTTDKQGWEIVVVDEQVSEKRGLFGNSKRNYFDEWKRCRRIWKDLRIALRDKDALIVHTNIPTTTFAMLREYVCAKITRRAGRKFVLHIHCAPQNMRTGKLWDIVMKKICALCDGVIVLNSAAEIFVKNYTDKTVQYIPNFVKEEEVKNTERHINEKVEKVLYVGGGVASKGCRELIDVATEFPEIEFRICGNCSDGIKEYKKLKQANNVILCGVKNKEGIQKELTEADVFMFLSYSEGFSVALTEAMAYGLPCIVTDCGANKDMIEGKGGKVVPIRDSKAAVEALKSIFSPEIRQEQSEFNIKKVKECYLEKKVVRMYFDLYDDILCL